MSRRRTQFGQESLPGCEDDPPPRKKRLRKAPTNKYWYTREVKGQAYQGRAWVEGVGSVNLGLFTVAKWGSREDAEWAAGRVSKAFRTRFKPGVTLKDLFASLKRDRLMPEEVLPPRVKCSPAGYVGRVKMTKSGVVLETSPLPCPWQAYDTLTALLAARPKETPKSELWAKELAARRSAKARARHEQRRAKLAPVARALPVDLFGEPVCVEEVIRAQDQARVKREAVQRLRELEIRDAARRTKAGGKPAVTIVLRAPGPR
jgi:hypothetical protein